MSGVDHFLAAYGYLAIFSLLMLGIVGPLIPDEAILVLSGVLIHRGQFHFLPTFLAALAGSLCGISLSFAVGLYGFGWLERRSPWLHQFASQHLDRAENWFLRFGKWTLFFGYFVAGVRHCTALFAGISRMPFRDFAPPAYSGALCWVFVFLGVGYFAGDQWSRYGGAVDRGIVIGVLIVIAAGLIFAAIRRVRSRDPNSLR